MDLDFSLISDKLDYILLGVIDTVQFTLLSALVGFLGGALLALIKISDNKPLKGFAVFYTSIFRGTPLILQLTLIYFSIPQLTGYDISPLAAGVIAFGLNSAAYTSETIRAGILAVDKGQREAAIALGIPYRKMMIDIIFPQALKNILPALVNESINLLKDSALVSVIGVTDVLRRANIVAAETFVYFEPLLLAGLLYYVMVIGLTAVARRFERRLRRSD
ncbi:amino acid ABC transporter permease [Brevibacillus choshinensis]|uniref:amino acid ABC transporter permease n=1 Tax=Brevibacillus choshinensis TaxID=54911 RepID=UPI002E23F360|nr:amino acid ABC transporter permease [Brevibacillus choshinensis]MED4754792.1 amino acid ABC transporter permease [Brevibacillus choshinensis]MED4784781.1 amino acid ABC transporter permease [Brevibacillus choshinensis]